MAAEVDRSFHLDENDDGNGTLEANKVKKGVKRKRGLEYMRFRHKSWITRTGKGRGAAWRPQKTSEVGICTVVSQCGPAAEDHHCHRGAEAFQARLEAEGVARGGMGYLAFSAYSP